MPEFGERLRKAREAKNLSQYKLAELLSQKLNRRVTHHSIYSYERNLRKPPLDVLTALADILGVSVDYLTGKEGISDEPEDDLQVLVSAMFRAQKLLLPDEKKRLINVIKAGWPELFEEEKEKGDG